VERILGEKAVGRGKKRSRKLLVKWHSYATRTWEPVDYLKNTEAFERWESSPKEAMEIRRRKQQRLKGGRG
jgi:hypothetical protein